MKKIITLVLLIGVLFQGYGQDNKSQQLLDQVSDKLSSYQAVYLEFKYSFDNDSENIHQQTRGNLTLKGDKYVLNYMGTTRIFDGVNVYTIIPENKEVTIEKHSSDDEQLLSPSKILNFYKTGYVYKWDIIQNNKGRKIQYIELKPEKKKSEIQKILLGIDVKAKNIYNMIEVSNSGAKTTLTVTQFRANPVLSDIFQFDREKYKKEGYYISEF